MFFTIEPTAAGNSFFKRVLSVDETERAVFSGLYFHELITVDTSRRARGTADAYAVKGALGRRKRIAFRLLGRGCVPATQSASVFLACAAISLWQRP